MPKSYEDPVKQLSREKWREFIVKYGFPVRKPQDTRVLCFPGAEPDRVAIEVTEVYDKLGIPRSNIIGLEIDKEKAERLKAAGLGIDVVCQNARQFFAETDKCFDVISLDYTGPQTLDASRTLEAIASRHVLSEKGVLATGYFARRESKALQRMMAHRYIHAFIGHPQKVETADDGSDFVEAGTYLSDLARFPAEEAVDLLLGRLDMNTLRDSSTYETIVTLAGGTIGWPVGKSLYEDIPERKKIIEELINDARAAFERGEMPHITRKQFFDGEEIEAGRAFAVFMTNKLVKELTSGSTLPIPRKVARVLIGTLSSHYQKVYLPRAIERYSYVSNSGSPMLVDLIAVKGTPYSLYSAVSDIFSFNPATRQAALGARDLSTDKLIKKLGDIMGMSHLHHRILLPGRVFLGSSYSHEAARAAGEQEDATMPEEEKQKICHVLDEKDARDFLKLGCSIDDILEAYPDSFTREQLTAYTSVPAQKDSGKKKEDRKVAPEHMAEVMQLIAEGRNSTEIAARFSGKYTWQAIAALKGLQTKEAKKEQEITAHHE